MPGVTNTVIFQVAIVTTGVAQQLPSHPLLIGGTLQASAAVTVGNTPAVTAATGYPLLDAGSVVSFSGSNTDQLWVLGTAASTVSFLGN